MLYSKAAARRHASGKSIRGVVSVEVSSNSRVFANGSLALDEAAANKWRQR